MGRKTKEKETRKRQKRKRGHKLLVCIIILLGMMILTAVVILLFRVQKIEITGNEYTPTKEIAACVEKDPYSANALYLLCKYSFFDYQMPESIENVRVQLENPWTVRIAVKEKTIVGCVPAGEKTVYFDREGTIVLCGSETLANVPAVEGIALSGASLYSRMLEENTDLRALILETLDGIEKYQLHPDRIVYEQNGMNLYFGKVCASLGDDVTTEKMAQISPILEEIGGQSGTLHLEHYEGENSTITFESDDFVPGVDDEKKMDENM